MSMSRNRVIAGHLARLESSLTRTQEAVSSLRDLLDHPQTSAPINQRYVRRHAGRDHHRSRRPVRCARSGIGGRIGELQRHSCRPEHHSDRASRWRLQHGAVHRRTGLSHHLLSLRPIAQAPWAASPPPSSRPAELATIVHSGPSRRHRSGLRRAGRPRDPPRTSRGGPIREYYLVGPADTPDESLWRTEVGWPIFQTRTHGP